MSTDLNERPEATPAARSVASREPGFLQRGRVSFISALREAANYGELRRTPYGLRPVLILTILAAAATFDGSVFGLALPDIINDLEISIQPLISAFAITNFFLVFAILGLAYVADRTRRTWIVGVGGIISGLFALFIPRAAGVLSLTILAVFSSLGGSAQGIPLGALQADYYPPQMRGKAYALLGVTSRVIGLVVPLSVAFLILRFGWRAPFYFTGPALILAGIVAILTLKEPIRGYMERKALGVPEEVARVPEETPSFGEAWRTIWSIRTLRRLFFGSIPAGAVDYILTILYPLFLFQFYGLRSPTSRALLGTVVGLVTLPFGFLAGGVLDVLLRRRPQRVLVLSGLLGVASSLFFIAVVAGVPLFVLYVVYSAFGAAGALLGPARGVLFSWIIPAHVRTQGFAVFGLASIPGTILRFVILNFAFERWGLQGALAMAVPFLLLSSLIDLSAAGFFERDFRSALASQLASEEWRAAKEEGKGKLLVCREIDVEYSGGVQVVFGVDFDVEEGEIIALLGTNGAGKSTLLRAISGTQEAAAGAIVLDGRDITHMPPHEIARRGVTHMPGGRAVFPGLTVRENLMMGNWLTDENEGKRRLETVYSIFPILKERSKARVDTLSGGEQQMVSLAQAFLSRPRLLMIDELSLGLSPAVVQQLIGIVRRIHEQGTTIILVEQSVNVALTLAKRAIFMEKGEVKFVGETRELLRRPDILRAVYVKGSGELVEGGPDAALKTERERRRYTLQEAPAALEVEGLSKSFGGIVAVDDVSFTLLDGEILGLIGPNGAGKTTVFDLISGYQIPDSGRIVFAGMDVTAMLPDERARRRLLRRFQDARGFPSLTVFENVLVALERKLEVRSMVLSALQIPQVRQAERRVRLRAERLMELVELGALRDKFVKELSTGLRRIVDLACVLATEPKVLLLDEPSTGIAQAEAESLAPLLRRVKFETGCSMLVIEHDMNLISSICDELLAMDQGRVVTRGAPDEVLNNDRVIESYLGTSEDAIRRSGVLS